MIWEFLLQQSDAWWISVEEFGLLHNPAPFFSPCAEIIAAGGHRTLQHQNNIIMEKEKLFGKYFSSAKCYNSPDKANNCITSLKWSIGQIRKKRLGIEDVLNQLCYWRKYMLICPLSIWGSFKDNPVSVVNVCLRTFIHVLQIKLWNRKTVIERQMFKCLIE